MKHLKRLALIAGALLSLGVVALGCLFAFTVYRDRHYYDFTETGGPIEEKYTALGPHDVADASLNAEASSPADRQHVWYPDAAETPSAGYPLVVMANGTGSVASTYTPVLRHLASWGFVVIANDDENSRSGASTAASVAYASAADVDPESELYGKVDASRVGVASHSQGGVGALNAATQQPLASQIDAIYLASPTGRFWGQADELGSDWSYEPTLVTVPTFLLAGTGYFDAGETTSISDAGAQGISPLWSMRETYDQLPSDLAKVMARRSGSDHGDSLQRADGYMTAWFMKWLRDDAGAAGAFLGLTPEIARNSEWRDVQISAP